MPRKYAKLTQQALGELPDEDKPRCCVTDTLLTKEQLTSGLFQSNLVRQTYRTCKRDPIKTLQHLQAKCVYFPHLGSYFKGIRGWRIACTKNQVTEEIQRQFYEESLREKNICAFPGCAVTVPFDLLHLGTCSKIHDSQKKWKCAIGSTKEPTWGCQLCTHTFTAARALAKHINRHHAEFSLEEYHLKYLRKEDGPDGTCKVCGDPTTFQSLKDGYAEFCGFSCAVNWSNEHTGRARRSGPKISAKLQIRGAIPAHPEYWIKQGYSEELAAIKVTERQTTNSVKAIQKRNGCSLEEAKTIRAEITAKWSSKTHTGAKWSKVSQELFWAVWEALEGTLLAEDVFFANFDKGDKQTDKNLEWRLKLPGTRYKLDFFVESLGAVIEFDGSWYHSGYWRPKYADAARDANILSAFPHYRILHIPEKDYRKDPQATADKCLQFLNSCNRTC